LQPGKRLHKEDPSSSGRRVGGTIGLPKPKGKDNKMRKQKSGMPAIVKVGYRGPRAARGLHPSGYIDNLIHNTAELLKLDPKKDAARIGHTVGKKKRIEINSKAVELGIKVLNPGNLISKMQKEKEKKKK
jgi:large subunit ribosomal protein L32e